MTLPTITVEVAFESNPYATTPVWTDVTAYVPQFATKRGRNYELARTEAGTLTLPFDNSDGRFDPLNTSSPYYPYVLPYRQIRVRATYSGTTYDVWRGFVERWPQQWAANGALGVVSITAVDGFKTVLGMKFGQSYAQTIAADSPYDYLAFPAAALGTNTGSNATTANCNAWATSAGAITGGTGDGAVSVVGQNRTFLGIQSTINTGIGSDFLITSATLTYVTVEGWFKVSAFPSDATAVFPLVGLYLGGLDYVGLVAAPKGGGWGLFGKTSGETNANIVDLGYMLTSGTTYHLAVTFNGSRVGTAYVNGVALGTTFTAGGNNGNWAVWVAPTLYNVNNTGLVLVIDEVAAYRSVLTAATLLRHYTAGSDPQLSAAYPQQTSSARVTAVLDTVKWPGARRSIESGSSTLVGTGSLTGSTALDVLQAAAADELGTLFIDGAGKVVFHNRPHRNSASSVVTFGDGSGEISYLGDITIDFDDTYICNDVQVTQSGSSPAYTAVAADVTSKTTYGLRTLSLSPALANQSDADGMAATLLAWYKDPHARVSEVTFEGHAEASLYPTLLGREIGDLVTVTRRPTGAPTITLNCFIDGVSHTVDAVRGTWVTKFTLTPQYPNTTY